MKKNILLLSLLCAYCIYMQAQDDYCMPDENGMYTYYANLKEKPKTKSFSKTEFTNLLKSSKLAKAEELSSYREEKEIAEACISFPTAETELLQHSISIKSPNPNLDVELGKYTDIFNFVEKDCSTQAISTYQPNDYDVVSSDKSGHLELINAPAAWEITKGDPHILIGITDTYIEETHEDLENQINQVLRNGESDWHGVAVAGCAAAQTDNSKGVASIGFNSKIVFSDERTNNGVLKMAQIPGVRVINCSWINSYVYSKTVEALYQEIRDVHNVVVTFGAGNGINHGGSLTAYVYPASYESVISVTSVGHSTDYGVELPTYGKHLWKDCHESTIGDPNSAHHHNDKVDICAPGYRVVSTSTDNSYINSWGTSFAAPIVAGVCALVASVNPCLTAKEIQDIVVSTADASIYDIPENEPYIGLLGSGRVDAYAAVLAAIESGIMHIENKTYDEPVIEEAETIMKLDNVTISSGNDATFCATREIEISPNFEFQSGGTLTLEIQDSKCF